MASHRKRRSSSKKPGPRQKKRGNLVPVLTGLLVLAVVGLLATLAVRFEAALTGDGATTQAPRATASIARPAPAVQAATLPVRTAIPASPGSVALGRRVEVTGTGVAQFRVRQSPGAGAPTVRVVPDGTRFLVTDGPVQADGLTWWQVDDQAGLTGWAAAAYLKLVP